MKNNKLFIILLMLALLIVGCKKSNTKSEFKQKDMAPNSLADLSKGIDEILKSVGEIERLNLNIPTKKEQENSKQSEQIGQKSSDSSQSTGQGGDSTGNSTGGQGGSGGGSDNTSGGGTQVQQKPETKEDKLKKQWDNIEKKLEGIHPSWNSFEVEGLKKGLTKENGDKFEAAINKLTKGVENKNIIEIYDYASQSYSTLKPFYDLYLDEVGGDISIIKYAAYQAYLKAIQADTSAAAELLSGRDENINKIRLKLTKEEEKSKVEKLSLGLGDFKEALKENSQILYMIKRDVIIQSVKDLE